VAGVAVELNFVEASEMRDNADAEAAVEFVGEVGGTMAMETEAEAGATTLERRRTMVRGFNGILELRKTALLSTKIEVSGNI
jgi:phage FluMu protein gp41